MRVHFRSRAAAAAAILTLSIVPGGAFGAPGSASRRVAVSDVSVRGWADPLTPPDRLRLKLHRYQAAGAQSPPGRVALVLLPCTACGTGWLDALARDLVGRGGVEVFTMERRGMALQERDLLDDLLRGRKKVAGEAISYYLGAQGKPAAWKRPGKGELPYLLMWGLRAMTEDMRIAIREARRLTGLPVVVGGFSGGAIDVMAFATRSFEDGGAGHQDLAGIVLLDGAFLPSDEATHEKLRTGMERYTATLDLDKGFWDIRDDLIRAEIAAALALFDPDGRTPLSEGVVPPEVAGPGMTNRAMFGWLLDLGKAPERGPLGRMYQIQMGAPAPPPAPGRLIDWADGGSGEEPCRLAQVASVARAPGGIFDWYYPAWLLREQWALWLNGFVDPAGGFGELERISAPVFTVVTKSAHIFGPGEPPLSGTWLFSRIAAKGNESITVPEFAHTDILVADAARERVYAPLHRWLMKVQPPAAPIPGAGS